VCSRRIEGPAPLSKRSINGTVGPVSVSSAPTPGLSLQLGNFGATEVETVIANAEAADRAGVDRVLVVDHVVMGSDTDVYRWGRFPTGPDEPWLEPLTLLALLAGRTERVRLGTGVLVAALRGGAVLAKTAATLDLVSGGRLDLGVGTGWQAREYEAAGLDHARRGPLLDETLETVRRLWAQAPATIDRPGGAVPDVWCVPRSPHVPIWVSGTLSRPVLRRLVRWGDAWIPIMGISTERLAADVVRLREAFTDAGRDPETLRVQGALTVVRGDLDATLDGAAELLAAGATDLAFPSTALSRDAEEARALLAPLAAGFRERYVAAVVS